MSDEEELSTIKTALVNGAKSKVGRATLTTDRVLFYDTKYMGGTGGAIGSAITDRLQRAHEDGGPLLDLPLSAITGVARRSKLFNKDRLALITADGEHLLNEGYKEWGPLLRQTLTGRHGCQIVDESADSWSVAASAGGS